jgi:formiminotetrahydrofolate cyclodeaminase
MDIKVFLDGLASADPAPGGGSAAALAGCLGCGLGSMVTRILLSRSGIRSTEKAQLRQGLRQLEKARGQLAALIREDAAVYGRLVAAQRRGGAALRPARLAALRCPLEICRQTVGAMKRLRGLLKKTGPYLGADVRAGQALLEGALRSAAEMAAINLRGGGLGRVGDQLETELERLERHE